MLQQLLRSQDTEQESRNGKESNGIAVPDAAKLAQASRGLPTSTVVSKPGVRSLGMEWQCAHRAPLWTGGPTAWPVKSADVTS